MTALLWACRNGHLPVVRELINVYKVDIFQTDEVRPISCAHHNAQHFVICIMKNPHTQTNFVLAVHNTGNW